MQAAMMRPKKEPKMQTIKRIFAVLAFASLLAAGTGCELDIVLGGGSASGPIIYDHYDPYYDVVIVDDYYGGYYGGYDDYYYYDY